jgi:hypothetical protein
MISADQEQTVSMRDHWRNVFSRELMERADEAERGSRPKRTVMAELQGQEADLSKALTICSRQIETMLAARKVVPGSRGPLKHEFLPSFAGRPSAHRFSVEFEEEA